MSGTPRDQSAWVLEEFPDRPNAVRWTYQITDKDYKEAVRQTLERLQEMRREAASKIVTPGSPGFGVPPSSSKIQMP